MTQVQAADRVGIMEFAMSFESGPFESGAALEETTLDPSAELDRFLRDVEGSAFRIALVSVRDRDDALDIVQDAMLRLATRYARRPADEWKPLFYRILQNRIRDWGRRRAVSRRVMSFFSGHDDEADPIEQAPGPAADNPLHELEDHQAMVALETALRALSERQRQVFMLRNFENLDVAQTALAMGVTDGSVKTHYSRAMSRLRELLGEHWS
jgi:RNA polymerase sigma-70 factor (ECF subfamily)